MPAIGGSSAAPAGNAAPTGNGRGGGVIYTDPWSSWNFQYTNLVVHSTGGGNTWNSNYSSLLTEEQLAQRAENDRIMAVRAEELRREAAEHTARATAAQERAEELLIEMLSDEQRRTREVHGFFEVVGSESGRTYRIRHGIVNNVDRLTEDRRHRDRIMCAHPPEIPDADCHLAQMLLLVTDENAFWDVANHHEIRNEREARLPDITYDEPRRGIDDVRLHVRHDGQEHDTRHQHFSALVTLDPAIRAYY